MGLGFYVPDDRLDGGPSPYFAFDRRRGAFVLAADPNPEFVRVIVTAVALVDVDPPDLDPGVLLDVGDRTTERMTVKQIAVQRLGVQHELTALGAGKGGAIETNSRIHKEFGPYLCRWIPPRGRAVYRPSARAAGGHDD